jgi:hypothetical protein
MRIPFILTLPLLLASALAAHEKKRPSVALSSENSCPQFDHNGTINLEPSSKRKKKTSIPQQNTTIDIETLNAATTYNTDDAIRSMIGRTSWYNDDAIRSMIGRTSWYNDDAVSLELKSLCAHKSNNCLYMDPLCFEAHPNTAVFYQHFGTNQTKTKFLGALQMCHHWQLLSGNLVGDTWEISIWSSSRFVMSREFEVKLNRVKEWVNYKTGTMFGFQQPKTVYVPQQKDYGSCGAFTVESGLLFLSGASEWNRSVTIPTGARKLREYQISNIRSLSNSKGEIFPFTKIQQKVTPSTLPQRNRKMKPQ